MNYSPRKLLPPLLLILSFTPFISTSLWAQDDLAQERIDALKLRLQAILERAVAVDDVNKLENLQRVYGYYTDKMLWDEIVDLFTEDGTMEIGSSGLYTGKEDIRQYLYSLSGNQQGPLEGEMYNHFQLQPVITLAEDGTTASGRWRAFIQTGTYGGGSGGQWGEGPYENEYIKEDGVWKIKKLHWFATFVAPYEGGWANASQDYVDAYSRGEASSENGNRLPEGYRPPFHYVHPVTGE